MAGTTKVLIVDDDTWKREGMAQRLADGGAVEVLPTVDHDTAARWPVGHWSEVDVALVDVFDDAAVGQVGTDMYAGIGVLERLRRAPVRTVAVTPSCAHPLVQLRIFQAEPDHCYHRYELDSLDLLVEVLRFPAADHRPHDVPPSTLTTLGARRLAANDLVRTFVASPLHGRLQATSGLKQLRAEGIHRSAVNRLRRQAVAHGYDHRATLAGATQDRFLSDDVPRWPAVRDLLLMLLGRLDGPWSEHDRPWWNRYP